MITRAFDLSRQALILALIMLFAIGTIRGGVISISKIVSTAGVSPFGYVFWQTATAAVLLTIMSGFRGMVPDAGKVYLRYYVVCALLGIVLPNALFFFVVRNVNAGSMAMVMTTVPLITYLYVLLFRMETANGLRALGIATGFVGAALMAWPDQGELVNLNWYLLLGFVCPASYALASIYASRLELPNKEPMLLACGTMIAASVLSLPIALSLNQFHPLWAFGYTETLIAAHGACAAILFTLFFKLVKLAGPLFYSQSTYIIGLTGIGWGMLLFDETHSSSFWLASCFILGGIALVNQQQRGAAGTPN